MWDTVEHRVGTATLSHDLPCPSCGHAAHSFLACSDDCPCVPPPMPGTPPRESAGVRVPEPAWRAV